MKRYLSAQRNVERTDQKQPAAPGGPGANAASGEKRERGNKSGDRRPEGAGPGGRDEGRRPQPGGQTGSGRKQEAEDRQAALDQTREMAAFSRIRGSPADRLDDENLTLRDVKRMREQQQKAQDHRDVAFVLQKGSSNLLRQPNGNPMSASVLSPSEDAFSDRAGRGELAPLSKVNQGDLEQEDFEQNQMSDVDLDDDEGDSWQRQLDPHTQRALNRGTPLSSPFKSSAQTKTEKKKQSKYDIELGNSAPLDDVITASKTAEQHQKFKKHYGGEPSSKLNDEKDSDAASDKVDDDSESDDAEKESKASCWRALFGMETLEEAPPFSAYDGILWMHLTCSLVLLVGLLVSIIFVQQLLSSSWPLLEHSQELLDNWNAPLLLDVQVRFKGEQCPDGYEILVSHMYRGSEDICDCLALGSVAERRSQIVMEASEAEDESARAIQFADDLRYFMKYYSIPDAGSNCPAECRFQKGIGETEQTRLSSRGLLVCGKRSKQTYLSIDRPRDSDEAICRDDEAFCYNSAVRGGDLCPNGQMVCPGMQGHDNLVCASAPDECPINHIIVLKTTEVQQLLSVPSFQAYHYNFRTISPTHTLAFSRHDDARPLTDFKLDFEVCMNKTEELGWPVAMNARNFYPGERLFNSEYEKGQNLAEFGGQTGCSSEALTEQRVDSRYKSTLLKVSEYDLQEQSGVLAKLKRLRNIDLFYQGQFGQEVSATLTVKKNYTMHLHAREALFFSRRCEIYGNFTRQDAARQLQEATEQVQALLRSDFFQLGQTIMTVQIVLLVLPTVLLCLLYKTNQRPANGTKSPATLKLFALSLLMHLLYLMVAVGFAVYIFLGTELTEIAAAKSAIRALYAEKKEPRPSLLTERGGRGCFDQWMLGWGYRYDRWLSEEEEKLQSYRAENVMPPAILGDLRSQTWRPDPAVNPILSHLSPLGNAQSAVILAVACEICLLLVLLFSVHYLVQYIKAVYLLRNYWQLDELYAPRHDDIAKARDDKREFTLADLLAKERLQRQMEIDEVAARKLAAMERRKAMMAIHQQSQLARPRAAAGARPSGSTSMETSSQRSAVSNIRGRKEKTRFERNLQMTQARLAVQNPEQQQRKQTKSRRAANPGGPRPKTNND